MTQGTCSIAECERPVRVKKRGWCARHYEAWQRHGDPLGYDPGRAPSTIVGKRFGRLTVVGFSTDRGDWECVCDCGRTTYGRRNHLFQGAKKSCGTPGPCFWRTQGNVSYDTTHARLRRSRGRAADHACVDCGGKAAHWSYDHADPNELVETMRGCEIRYSIDLDHYEARCRSCHRRFDLQHARGAQA